MKHDAYLLIRQNHAVIDELMTAALRELTERHEPVLRVSQLMNELRARVNARFEEEVENGLFRNLTATAPRLQHAITALSQDHEQLLQQLDAICQCVETPSLSAADWDALEERFHQFSAFLEGHETREQDLILEAYDDDLGSGD